MSPVKLVIHGETAPIHLERFAPDRFNFQPIHLRGSFMESPILTTGDCDPHLLLLPPSKRNSPPLSDFRTPPPPRSRSAGSYFGFMTRYSKLITTEVGFPNFFQPEQSCSHRIFALTKVFGAKRSKWLGTVPP
ncbi:hypothetical protein AVEN_227131-1 [Araneus ventricosus]|uniref:Uncharacterized protein n=1 Tax=Araneus ventricosus TaxID=182803 RepID=A0A4Y2BUF1_ARAVE|nr:hypothetical protein AVEN_227131-1 [Araneus ventricosus]